MIEHRRSEHLIYVPEDIEGTADELRWAAKQLRERDVNVGMGVVALIVSAFQIPFTDDEQYDIEEIMYMRPWKMKRNKNKYHTLQVLILTLAAEIMEDQCQCCGRPY